MHEIQIWCRRGDSNKQQNQLFILSLCYYNFRFPHVYLHMKSRNIREFHQTSPMGPLFFRGHHDPSVKIFSRLSVAFKSSRHVGDSSRPARHAWRSSNSSRASTTPDTGTPPWATSAPTTSNGQRRRLCRGRRANFIVRLEPSPVLPGAASQRSRHTPRGHPIYRIGRRLYVHRLSPTSGLGTTALNCPLKRGNSSRSSRAWLWTSVSEDAVYFHVDPSRGAGVARKLFGTAGLHTVIVCDRDSAYKKMARIPGGLVTLAWCWSHMRRDFIHCAAGEVRVTRWCRRWIERIALIYRLNEARLAHYDPGRDRQSAAFDAAQAALKKALDGLFAEAGRVGLLAGARARGQGVALAAEPSRGLERLRRPPADADGQQRRRARAEGTGDRETALVRLRQRDRRPVHGDDVLGPRYPRAGRHRPSPLAGGMAGGMCGERRPGA